MENPEKEGALLKEGQVVKSWRECWFVLKGDNLYIFKEQDKRKLIGVVPLRDMIAREAPEKDKDRTFTIRHKQGASPPIYLRSAADDADFTEWLRLLRQATVRASAGSELKAVSREEPTRSSPRTLAAPSQHGAMNRSHPIVGSLPSGRPIKTSDQDLHLIHGETHDIRSDSAERSRSPESSAIPSLHQSLVSTPSTRNSSSSESSKSKDDLRVSGSRIGRRSGLRWRSMTDPGSLFQRAAAFVSATFSLSSLLVLTVSVPTSFRVVGKQEKPIKKAVPSSPLSAHGRAKSLKFTSPFSIDRTRDLASQLEQLKSQLDDELLDFSSESTVFLYGSFVQF